MGGRAGPADVIAVSRLFDEEIALAFKPPLDELDRAFLDQLEFVWNQAVQALRKTGWTRETLVRVGGLLLRLYEVFQVYKARKKVYTLAEWLVHFADLGKELNDAISTLPRGA